MNNQDIIALTVDRLNESKIVMPKRRRWSSNYHITRWRQEVSYFGDQTSWKQGVEEKASTQQRDPSGPRLINLAIRGFVEKMLEWEHDPERLGPQALGWPAQENGKETQLWAIEWGSICCSSVWSPTPSHTQPFQIKWEVYFSKRTVSLVFIVSSLWFCMHAFAYEYTRTVHTIFPVSSYHILLNPIIVMDSNDPDISIHHSYLATL